MTGFLSGYTILIVFGLILFGISLAVGTKTGGSVESYLLANRQVSCGLIAASALVSWTWTTTIMGAAEAGMWYGVSGGIGYSIGAGVPFLLFVPLMLRFKKIMPQGVTYTEFIGQRFGNRTKDVYFTFAVLVVLYIFLEQLVGVGLVFRNVFGISFKVTVVLAVIPVIFCIVRGGIRSVLFNNVLLFLIIGFFWAAIFVLLTKNLGIDFLYRGLSDASGNVQNPNHDPSLLLLSSFSGMRYGLIALIVALGQVLLDQGYYTIALGAKRTKTLIAGFLIGAVFAWMPISILSANLFGHGAIALLLSPGQGIDTTTDIATTILDLYGGPVLSILFAVMILSIVAGTGGTRLLGLLSIFTVDFYTSKLRPGAKDREKIRFGRVITVCIAALCSFIAIALDGISLLKIDMFSGIFFAAPCCTLLVGMYSKYANESIVLAATAAGILIGLSTWVYFGMSSESWFYSCLLSFLTPFFVTMITFPLTRRRFNFTKLQFYGLDETNRKN